MADYELIRRHLPAQRRLPILLGIVIPPDHPITQSLLVQLVKERNHLPALLHRHGLRGLLGRHIGIDHGVDLPTVYRSSPLQPRPDAVRICFEWSIEPIKLWCRERTFPEDEWVPHLTRSQVCRPFPIR